MEWPLFDLRMRCGPVSLRPVTDADLPRLAAILPDDLDHDPRVERFVGLDGDRDHRRLMVQGIWRARGTWSPSKWCLDLAVEHGGAARRCPGAGGRRLRHAADGGLLLLAGRRTPGARAWGSRCARPCWGSPSTTSVRSRRSPRRSSTTRRRWGCRAGSGTPTTGSAAPALDERRRRAAAPAADPGGLGGRGPPRGGRRGSSPACRGSGSATDQHGDQRQRRPAAPARAGSAG